MKLLPAVVERQRRPVRDRIRRPLAGRAHFYGHTVPVYRVAGRTGDRGFVRMDRQRHQTPGTFQVNGLDQVADAVLEVHPVALETIVAQNPVGVVTGIEEDLAVGRVVRSCGPGGVFLLMTLAAARVEAAADALLPEQEPLGNLSAEVEPELAHIVEMKSGIGGKNAAMAFPALDVSVGGRSEE